jgi:hypothetical protein
MGWSPGSNREQSDPHSGALPIELHHPDQKNKKYNLMNIYYFLENRYNYYVGVTRTLNSKYQKFMTYPISPQHIR